MMIFAKKKIKQKKLTINSNEGKMSKFYVNSHVFTGGFYREPVLAVFFSDFSKRIQFFPIKNV